MQAATLNRRSTRLMLRAGSVALCAAGTLLWATAAAADDGQARYQRDRAACISGQTNQDRATCLREAGAALQEARRGGLTSAEPEQNRYARCASLPGDQRTDCMRRMDGEGIIRGSVEEGGIYRELRTVVPAPSSSLEPSLR